MLTSEGRLPIEMAPNCRVVELGFRVVEDQIQHWINTLMLPVNVEVVGTTGAVLVHVWTQEIGAQLYVRPEDFVNHRQCWARRNPTFAAVVVGLTAILTELRFIARRV